MLFGFTKLRTFRSHEDSASKYMYFITELLKASFKKWIEVCLSYFASDTLLQTDNFLKIAIILARSFIKPEWEMFSRK